MPKFNGQNKKRSNPRYFLNETVEKEEIKEGERERTWDDAYAMGLPEPEFRAPWNSTKDMIDKLGEQAREASKAIYGYKVDVGNMTLDQIQDLLYDMSNSDVQRAMDDEAQREDDMAIGMQDDELDNSPKRMGMGRMEEEEDKNDSKFPDHSGDGKITQKDILMAKGVIPKPSNKKKSKKDKLKEMIEKELVSLLEVSWVPKDDLQMQFRKEYMPMGRLAPEYEEIEKAFRADNIVQYGISDILSIAARQDREKNRIEQASRVLMRMGDDPAAAKVLDMINKLKAKKL